MIHKLREEQGRPFDVRQLTTSCVANVIMNMLFGHRFDHSDPAFQQAISDIHEGAADYSMALHIFPGLRFLPHFKRHIARNIIRIRSFTSFVDNNIATCIQVYMLFLLDYVRVIMQYSALFGIFTTKAMM